ncbi:MAG TPA: hypothetical protein VJ957_06590, partial [Longimicrobiales bacterium]|nr:hypothetical protein [Longimicrobiales bacterium]
RCVTRLSEITKSALEGRQAEGVDQGSELRRGMICGSALGSFAVERFGLERLRDLRMDEIRERVRKFRTMTAFEEALPSHV